MLTSKFENVQVKLAKAIDTPRLFDIQILIEKASATCMLILLSGESSNSSPTGFQKKRKKRFDIQILIEKATLVHFGALHPQTVIIYLNFRAGGSSETLK